MKMFLIQREIDGLWYGGRIPARDWDEAELICRQAGLTLDGKFVPGGSISMEAETPDEVTTILTFKSGTVMWPTDVKWEDGTTPGEEQP